MTHPVNPFIDDEEAVDHIPRSAAPDAVRSAPVNPFLEDEEENAANTSQHPVNTRQHASGNTGNSAAATVKTGRTKPAERQGRDDAARGTRREPFKITGVKTTERAVPVVPDLEAEGAAPVVPDLDAEGSAPAPARNAAPWVPDLEAEGAAPVVPDLDAESAGQSGGQPARRTVKNAVKNNPQLLQQAQQIKFARAPELPNGERNLAQEFLDQGLQRVLNDDDVPLDEHGVLLKYLFAAPLTADDLALLTPEQSAFVNMTTPIYLSREYRKRLTAEQKLASKLKKEEKAVAKKVAYARGLQPWKGGQRSASPSGRTQQVPLYTPPGHKKQPKYTSYKRRDITEKDLLTFLLIAKFRYITPKLLGRVLGVKFQAARKRLRGLEELGFLRRSNPGLGDIWVLKKAAVDTLNLYGWEHLHAPIFNPDNGSFDLNGMAHQLSLAWGAIELTLGNVPVPGKRSLPKVHEWQQIITEHQMRREMRTVGGTDSMIHDKREATERVLNGDMSWTDFYHENPARWILPGSKIPDIKLKIPDFAIDLTPHQKGDDPVSAAVEVELTRKSAEDYRNIFRQYEYDKHTYGGVIYLVNNEANGEFIKKIAREERFKRLIVAPLLDEHGDYLKHPLTLLQKEW